MSNFFADPPSANERPVLRPRPLQRNPSFTGHAALLASLPLHFARTPLLVLSGREGIGKTQIALEYACRFADAYETILWLNASSRVLLSQSVHGLFAWTPAIQQSWWPEDAVFALMRDWLQTHTNWLLVLDQLGESPLLDLIVPADPQGHLLITTRQTLVGSTGVLASPTATLSKPIRRLLSAAQMLVVGGSPTQEREQVARRILQAITVPTMGASLTRAVTSFEQQVRVFRETRAGQKAAFERELLVSLRNQFSDLLPSLLLDVLRVLAAMPTEEPLTPQQEEQAAHAIPEPVASLLADPVTLEQTLMELQEEELLSRAEPEGRLRLHPGLRRVLVSSLGPDDLRPWTGLGIRVWQDSPALRVLPD